MIPLHIKISGFLSYQNPVEMDFSGFDLACISGQNGAGKSSLLDAMTWALFGQARKRDDSVINLQSSVAEVVFTFQYEQDTYRIIRRMPRGKTPILEFQMLEKSIPATVNGKSSLEGEQWMPLTEHSQRETQNRIEQILRLDYDTFINVSFFLQGRADLFAQQSPTRRKEILGAILGLERWEVFKDRAAGSRKAVESDLQALGGRLAEIDKELEEEVPRRERLASLTIKLEGLTAARKAQETRLEGIRGKHQAADKQRELVEMKKNSQDRSLANLTTIQSRLLDREAERSPRAALVTRAAEVEATYQAWQSARLKLEEWDKVAMKFHEQERQRQPFLNEVLSERLRLEHEKTSLEERAEVVTRLLIDVKTREQELETKILALTDSDRKLERKGEIESQIQALRENMASLGAENNGLKLKMEEKKAQIKNLEAVEGATCPLCGQTLSQEHRQSTLLNLQGEGTAQADQYRTNTTRMEEINRQLAVLEEERASLLTAEADRRRFSAQVTQLTERLDTARQQVGDWDEKGAKRLSQMKELLESGQYALEARKELARLDNEMESLGYRNAEHETARQQEEKLRFAESDFHNLEAARAALTPLDDEIANLHSQLVNLEKESASDLKEYVTAVKTLEAMEAELPDLDEAERTWMNAQELENLVNQEVGAARQKVDILGDLRVRKKKFEKERDELGLQIGRYKSLERAFGKDGVPALLIEQALPLIEDKANQLLGRLSDDTMRLRFETQAKYKAEKRKDLRETLEIQVSDGAGERDYEMYSGGEAFRVNFSLRLALSEVLAQRMGARLQMLVIDEGFGSQDALGRQRLIQAINTVRPDFAKILVITHLDELKDAFPTRIEVEKSGSGSQVRVV